MISVIGSIIGWWFEIAAAGIILVGTLGLLSVAVATVFNLPPSDDGIDLNICPR